MQGSTQSNGTKLTGDVAEQAVILQALKRGWQVLRPIGDRSPYDLVIDVDRKLIKVQVKMAWMSKAENREGVWCVDSRRCKTNRRVMRHDSYDEGDFDFVVICSPSDLFWVMPAREFMSYRSTVHLRVEAVRSERCSKYLDAWDLIGQKGSRTE